MVNYTENTENAENAYIFLLTIVDQVKAIVGN